MKLIPEELLLELLSRTPTKHVLRSAAVSKSWSNLISDAYFLNLHVSRMPSGRRHYPTPLFFSTLRIRGHSIINMSIAGDSKTRQIRKDQSFEDWNMKDWCENDYEVHSSCNGLICVAPNDYKKPIEVCNPLTFEYTSVPPPCGPEDHLAVCSVGLGFSPSKKEYKVVAMVADFDIKFYRPEEGTAGKIMVRKLGSVEPWRHVEDVYFTPRKGPIYIQGKMYWVISYLRTPTKFHMISFDVEEERFEVIENVPVLTGKYELVEFDGKISTVLSLRSSIEIWVLEDCKKSEWRRRHRIELPAGVQVSSTTPLVGLWERDDGCVQIWLKDVMVVYDERIEEPEEKCTMYEAPRLPDNWNLCTNYKPSMVSLNGMGCESDKACIDRFQRMDPPSVRPKRRVIDVSV